tara:strand:- start:110 stop:604 length:495 start_codon:yes stop_codon:yes gene_type:complete
MKTFPIFLILFYIITSCAFKPLYKQTNSFYPNEINIIIKSEENYENNVSMMKAYLNKKLNSRALKKSNLKLIISIDKNVSNLGVNKDLNSFARSLEIKVLYSLKDKKGELMSGNLKNSANFNYTTNNYANILSLEDASNKLIKSLSNDIADLILVGSFARKIQP